MDITDQTAFGRVPIQVLVGGVWKENVSVQKKNVIIQPDVEEVRLFIMYEQTRVPFYLLRVFSL